MTTTYVTMPVGVHHAAATLIQRKNVVGCKLAIQFFVSLNGQNLMGKRRAYCPYCDVFLVHNSLRSRRDHNEGWRHLAAFQAYYARFAAQNQRSTKQADTDPITPTPPKTQAPAVPPQAPPPPSLKPPQIAPNPMKPNTIRPPKLAPPPVVRAGPPPIRQGPPPIQKK